MGSPLATIFAVHQVEELVSGGHALNITTNWQ